MLASMFLCVVQANRTCLQGWVKEKDNCYKVIHDNRSWQSASDLCDDLESRLVTLNDQDEHDFVLQLRSQKTEDKLWIGFYKNNSVWAWLDMNETAINHLNTRNASNDSHCAAITKTGVWVPLECSQNLPFICEANVTGCPTRTGWIEHDFRCLYMLSTKLEWNAARYRCNEIGAELAVLNNLKADSFLQSQTALHDWLWVGLKFDSNFHNYTWIDGRRGYMDKVTTASPMLNGGCGAVGVNNSTRQLISMTTSCDTRLSAVCEKARVTRPLTTPTIPTTTQPGDVSSSFASNTVLQGGIVYPATNVTTQLENRTQATSLLTDESGTNLTKGQRKIYRRVVNCFYRINDSDVAECLDEVILRTSCSSNVGEIFAVVIKQASIMDGLKVTLLKYTMSAISRFTMKKDSLLFCSKEAIDVLDAIEQLVGNYIVTTSTDKSLSLSNKDISVATVDVNQSLPVGPYYEGDIAGCIVRNITPPSSGSIVGDLKLAVILTTTNNKPVTFEDWTGLDEYYIISAVLTMSVYRGGHKESVAHTFTLLHTFDMTMKTYFYRNTTEILCAFYIPSKRVWSGRGCGIVKTDSYTTTCGCNHTTSFAVLMKVKTYQMARFHQTALSIITIMGCSISMITSFLSLTVFTCIRSLGSERVFVHRNLSLSILLAQVIFLAGIKATYHKMVCRVIAIVLHYCYMSVFTWMLVEGLHLYTKVVQVFGTEESRTSYYLLFGWGIPLVLVTVSSVADFDGYGTDSSCWLSIYRSTIWAFVGPAVAVMVVNVAILVMVLRIVISSVKLDRPRHTDQILAGIKGTLFLLPLLGLTWVFGLLAINRDLIVFEYAFAVCNSLQGFFVFLFHCVLNTEVRQALQRLRDRQIITIRGETVVYTGSGDGDSLPMGTRNRKTRFLISGTIRVSPITGNQAIDTTDMDGTTLDKPGSS